MATAAFCAARASFAAPARADAARGPARLVRWRAATPRASPAPPFAEPSSTRIDARGVGARVARLRRIARRAVVDTRHPLASFDDGDARRDATERAPPDEAALPGARDDELSTETCSGDARKDDASVSSAVSVLATTSADGNTTFTTLEDSRWERNTTTLSRKENPWWVSMLNASLTQHPGFVLLGFVLVDITSALVLLALIVRLQIPVDGDFALAYALSKSIRAPRLAFDAVVAGWLSKAFPPLAAVRVGPILDKAIELGAKLSEVVSSRRRRLFPNVTETPRSKKDARNDDENESRRARAAREAREMTDAYGLAYMAAKNIIGPVSIALFYVLLKYGVDVRGALAFFGAGAAGSTAAAAGKTAGALALASWVSTLFFPLVVLGAGYIGPKMGRGAEWVKRGAWRGGAEAARRADAA
jgi:hypothetical protein